MFALKARSAGHRDPAALPLSELERGLRVSGHLETEGELHIYGAVTGRIDADVLVLCAGSQVEGDVLAREVRVAGTFTGRIFAPTVAIDDKATVTGRIFHNTVTVARGARFEGRMPWRPIQYFETLDQLPETQP
jgi:cytoskeletal protein CcmA (bactofilin family)